MDGDSWTHHRVTIQNNPHSKYNKDLQLLQISANVWQLKLQAQQLLASLDSSSATLKQISATGCRSSARLSNLRVSPHMLGSSPNIGSLVSPSRHRTDSRYFCDFLNHSSVVPLSSFLIGLMSIRIPSTYSGSSCRMLNTVSSFMSPSYSTSTSRSLSSRAAALVLDPIRVICFTLKCHSPFRSHRSASTSSVFSLTIWMSSSSL